MPEAKSRTSSRRKDQANLDTLGLEMGNKPPQALDVEEAVLGAMLIEPSCVDQAMEEFNQSSEYFYDPKHRMIFEAMCSLVNEHAAIDLLTVSSKLKAEGNLDAVGGSIFVADLTRKVGTAAHIEYYIKILKQKNIQRNLITSSYDILKQAYDDSINVDDLIDSAQSKVYDAIKNNVKKEVQEVGSLINEALTQLEERQGQTGLSGVPSGFPTIDAITQGWQPTDLIILAARPSVGKTAFSLNLARNAAVQFHMPVAFFSLEMSALQLVKRLMTSESGLAADKIKGGVKLEPYEWKQLEVKLKELASAPLYIDDTPGLPITEFRTKLKTLVKNKGVRLVFVDYLQLMQGPPELRGLREQEVAAISRTLKATAKELNVPIIALSQLSRNAVQRTGSTGKPQLSDLRESGSIEQDADMVIFIHRPDFLGFTEDPEARGNTQVIIAKHRNGATTDVDMNFVKDQVRFMELDEALDVAARSMDSAMNNSPFYDSPSQAGGFAPNEDF